MFERPLIVLGIIAASTQYLLSSIFPESLEELEAVQNVRGIPLIIILPTFIGILYFNLLFVSQRLESDARIVAYIQLFHENELFNQWIGWETSLRFYRKTDFNTSSGIKEIQNKGKRESQTTEKRESQTTEKRESQNGFYLLVSWFSLLLMTLIFLVWIYMVYTFGIDISHRYLLLVILLVIIFILNTYLRFYKKSRDFNLFAEIKKIINKLGNEKSKSQTGFYPLIFWFHLIFITLIFLVWIFVVYTFEIDKSHENLPFVILFIVILYISIIAYLLLLKRCFEELPYFENKDLLENERDKWFCVHIENREDWETARITRETQTFK